MDYTLLLQKYFVERFKEMGCTITSSDTYQTGDTDFRAQLTRLKALSPQPNILFISSGPDDIGTIVKQVRELGINTPIVDAIKRADTDNPKAIRNAIAATKGFEGVTGTINFPPGKRVPQKSTTIIQVKKGKFMFLNEVMPEKIPAP